MGCDSNSNQATGSGFMARTKFTIFEAGVPNSILAIAREILRVTGCFETLSCAVFAPRRLSRFANVSIKRSEPTRAKPSRTEPAVASGAISTVACATIGPLSTPSSSWKTVTPVVVSPSNSTCCTGDAPGYFGSSE